MADKSKKKPKKKRMTKGESEAWREIRGGEEFKKYPPSVLKEIKKVFLREFRTKTKEKRMELVKAGILKYESARTKLKAGLWS